MGWVHSKILTPTPPQCTMEAQLIQIIWAPKFVGGSNHISIWFWRRRSAQLSNWSTIESIWLDAGRNILNDSKCANLDFGHLCQSFVESEHLIVNLYSKTCTVLWTNFSSALTLNDWWSYDQEKWQFWKLEFVCILHCLLKRCLVLFMELWNRVGPWWKVCTISMSSV